MQLSSRMSKIKPSATLAVNAKALELKAKGVKVISLSVGEPDFPTPKHICDAAIAAVNDGFTRYTAVPGMPELRKAVSKYFARNNGIEPPVESIIVTNGGKQALFNIFMAILNDGDEVLVPAPYWVSYPDMVLLAGGVPVAVPCAIERGFKLSVEDLQKKITPKTRALVLNFPSNPTGACLSQAELDAIMQWAMDNNVFVISDEIYDMLTYAAEGKASALSWWERYPEKVAIAHGTAKSFSMTGWRVGYSVTHPALTKALISLQGQSTANICSIAQKAALAALEGPLDCVLEMREAFIRRRDLIHSTLSSWPGVVCPKPEGAFYIFPDFSALYKEGRANSSQMCEFLLEKANVALVPGAAFGDDTCVRFSYAVSDDTLKEALKRIHEVLF